MFFFFFKYHAFGPFYTSGNVGPVPILRGEEAPQGWTGCLANTAVLRQALGCVHKQTRPDPRQMEAVEWDVQTRRTMSGFPDPGSKARFRAAGLRSGGKRESCLSSGLPGYSKTISWWKIGAQFWARFLPDWEKDRQEGFRRHDGAGDKGGGQLEGGWWTEDRGTAAVSRGCALRDQRDVSTP